MSDELLEDEGDTAVIGGVRVKPINMDNPDPMFVFDLKKKPLTKKRSFLSPDSDVRDRYRNKRDRSTSFSKYVRNKMSLSPGSQRRRLSSASRKSKENLRDAKTKKKKKKVADRHFQCKYLMVDVVL